jgi:hypothetical protein
VSEEAVAAFKPQPHVGCVNHRHVTTLPTSVPGAAQLPVGAGEGRRT